jgi:hypothetical protein
MKLIKPGEYLDKTCTVVAGCSAKAAWRSTNRHLTGKYACANHVKQFRAIERADRDDGYMTEADRQTWGRL